MVISGGIYGKYNYHKRLPEIKMSMLESSMSMPSFLQTVSEEISNIDTMYKVASLSESFNLEELNESVKDTASSIITKFRQLIASIISSFVVKFKDLTIKDGEKLFTELKDKFDANASSGGQFKLKGYCKDIDGASVSNRRNVTEAVEKIFKEFEDAALSKDGSTEKCKSIIDKAKNNFANDIDQRLFCKKDGIRTSMSKLLMQKPDYVDVKSVRDRMEHGKEYIDLFEQYGAAIESSINKIENVQKEIISKTDDNKELMRLFNTLVAEVSAIVSEYTKAIIDAQIISYKWARKAFVMISGGHGEEEAKYKNVEHEAFMIESDYIVDSFLDQYY